MLSGLASVQEINWSEPGNKKALLVLFFFHIVYTVEANDKTSYKLLKKI